MHMKLMCTAFIVLHTKAFDGNVKTPPSSTQIYKTWSFCGPLLWTLIISALYRFLVGFKAGDWLGHSSSFNFFFWNHPRISSVVCLGSLSFWNIIPSSIFIILIDGSRFSPRMSWNIFFINPSFTSMEFVSIDCSKTASHHDVPTSKVHCWCGVLDVRCHFYSKHGVF